MRINRFCASVAVVGLLCAAAPAPGHHAVQAQFDFDKPIELKGTLAKVEWVNPHAYFRLDVKDETGKMRRWGFEAAGPAGLRRAGFARGANSFTVGDTYTFVGFMSRDGSDSAYATAVLFPDGRKITIWFGDPFAN